MSQACTAKCQCERYPAGDQPAHFARPRLCLDFVINQSGNGDSVNGMPVPTMTLVKDCETPN